MAGTSSNCIVCGEIIAVPAVPLIIGDTECGVIIDLDAQWRAEVDHYTEKHPDVPLPERLL